MPSSFPSLRIFVPLFLVPLSFSLPRFRHVLLSTSLFSVFRHHPASPSSFFRVFYFPPPAPPQPVTHYVTVFQCSCLSTWLLSLPQCLSFTQPTGGSPYPEVPRSLLSPAVLPGNSVSPSLIPSDRPPALPPSIAISVSLPSSIFPSFCLPPSQPPKGLASLGTAVPAFLSLSWSRRLSRSLCTSVTLLCLGHSLSIAWCWLRCHLSRDLTLLSAVRPSFPCLCSLPDNLP